MSLGLPSIVSDYGGNPWLVKDGDNGLIFPSQDSRALAACIARLMDRPEERVCMGEGPGGVQGAVHRRDLCKNVEQVYLDILKADIPWNKITTNFGCG